MSENGIPTMTTLERMQELLKGIDAQCDAIRFIEEERFERIEHGLDALLQSHAALKKKMDLAAEDHSILAVQFAELSVNLDKHIEAQKLLNDLMCSNLAELHKKVHAKAGKGGKR